jgi:hypothetical protein
MNDAEVPLPPPKELHATLRKITETLAAELARPTDTAPDWSDFEWLLARGVAGIHGVSSLLGSTLKWDGPPGWKPFLVAQRAHVAARHRRIEDLLDQLDARSRDEKVPLIALKGAALHAMGLYRAGERPMADIDLLVQPQEAKRAEQVLESLGFSESFANWKHKVFVPAVREVHAGVGEHAKNYLKIELHQRVAEILPLRITDVTGSILPPRPHPGLNAYPSKAALMTHLLIHAASAMAYRSLRLLHLHDIGLVSSRMSGPDWDELLEHGRNGGGPWWALPPLQLTARYYPTAVPKDGLAALADHCQWTLRRATRHQSLSDVSLSYPWIEAFPGIGWCRSLAEVIELIVSRIRPGDEMLRLRKVMVETQVSATQTDWGRLSQGQRMLRWVVSRQTRADTLHAVRSALSQLQKSQGPTLSQTVPHA